MAVSANLTAILTKSINNLMSQNATLEEKLSDSVPRTCNSQFQSEMNKIHTLYQRFIQAGIYNLKRQIELFELKKRFEQPKSLSELQEQQEKLEQLQQAFTSHQAGISQLEKRILELTSKDSPEPLPADWLNKFIISA